MPKADDGPELRTSSADGQQFLWSKKCLGARKAQKLMGM